MAFCSANACLTCVFGIGVVSVCPAVINRFFVAWGLSFGGFEYRCKPLNKCVDCIVVFVVGAAGAVAR